MLRNYLAAATVAGLMLAAGCTLPEAPEAPEARATRDRPDATPDLLPRDAVFGNPTKIQGRVSPDGSHLSWLAPVAGVMNIWVAPSDNPGAARAITRDSARGIPFHLWAPGGEYLLYQQDQGGDENYHVYAVEVATGTVRDLTPVAEGARATLEAISRDRPGVVLVGLNDRDPQLFDLYAVDIGNGERTLVAENPGFALWVVDNALSPRLALRQMPGQDAEVLQAGAGGDWEPFQTIPAEDVLTTRYLSFDADNTHVYAIDSRGRDTSALVRIAMEDASTEVIAHDPRADVSNALINPATHEPEAYAVNYTRMEWHPLTDAARHDLAAIRQTVEGDLDFLSATDDGRSFVVFATTAREPGTYYLYQRGSSALDLLFETRPELSADALQPMQTLALQARDGLTLVSYLTLPPGADANADGVPETPVPMVLYVHGGPWARDTYGYNATHQWLANRGYAVLSVNYRGSTGFGKDFVNQAAGEFSGRMHDDLIDAVDWAVRRKVAAPERVAIMGGSYGGYATLVGVTFTPDAFACGVDIVGPSSLVTLVESFPPYWAPLLEHTWFKYVGNPANEDDRAEMFNRSPISRVQDIRVPLLIGQGGNDPRVTKGESDQIVAAMEKRDLPVTYLNYPDEGHGFARPENRLSFYAVAEAFLAQCLGGRYEPIGGDFEGSSVQVLNGADYVPGLSRLVHTPEQALTP